MQDLNASQLCIAFPILYMFSKRDNCNVQIKVFVGYKIVITSGTFCLAINSCYHSFFNYKIEQIPIRTIQEMFKLIYS